MRRLLVCLVAAGTLACSLMVAAPSTGQAPFRIKPATLERGTDIATPHVDEDHVIVDGDRRIEVKAARVNLLGRWTQSYVAVIGNAQWGNVRLVTVSPTGTVKVLRTHVDPFNVVLDPTAGRVAYSFGVATQKPTLAVFDLASRQEVASRSFSSLPELLDFDQGTAVASFGSFRIKTVRWTVDTDTVARVNGRLSNYASVDLDLLASYTKDPYMGGCQVLTRLSSPGKELWRSCEERIDAVSPDGQRIATIPLLTDGRGASDAVVRRRNGAVLAEYTISGWFGQLTWESPKALLIPSFGAHRSATVRCVKLQCERATDTFPTPDLAPPADGRGPLSGVRPSFRT